MTRAELVNEYQLYKHKAKVAGKLTDSKYMASNMSAAAYAGMWLHCFQDGKDALVMFEASRRRASPILPKWSNTRRMIVTALKGKQ